MRASDPLKSKRFAISLLDWSTAFFSSTLLTSETMSKEGISDFPRVDAELYRPSFSSKGKPELGCRDHPDRPSPCRVSPLLRKQTLDLPRAIYHGSLSIPPQHTGMILRGISGKRTLTRQIRCFF